MKTLNKVLLLLGAAYVTIIGVQSHRLNKSIETLRDEFTQIASTGPYSMDRRDFRGFLDQIVESRKAFAEENGAIDLSSWQTGKFGYFTKTCIVSLNPMDVYKNIKPYESSVSLDGQI